MVREDEREHKGPSVESRLVSYPSNIAPPILLQYSSNITPPILLQYSSNIAPSVTVSLATNKSLSINKFNLISLSFQCCQHDTTYLGLPTYNCIL